MVIAVLADEQGKLELSSGSLPEEAEIIWVDGLRALTIVEADMYFDLQFEFDPERISVLKRIKGPLVVNSVIHTCSEIGIPVVRVNGWPGSLNREVLELATSAEHLNQSVSAMLDQLKWNYEWVPDVAGMITPRIIAMIVQEARLTNQENIGSIEDIDIAMKLGTNYPCGPFEWAALIGMHRIEALLDHLGKTDQRYKVPAFKILSEDAIDPVN